MDDPEMTKLFESHFTSGSSNRWDIQWSTRPNREEMMYRVIGIEMRLDLLIGHEGIEI
jgi:hypothetical protein